MKVIKFLTIVSTVLAVMVSCTKPDCPDTPVDPNDQTGGGNGGQTGGENGGQTGGGTELPTPPDKVVENNLFLIDFFSSLSDEKYFEKRDPSVLESYIKELKGRKPLVYMVDRADFEVGKSDLVLPLARNLKYTSYFAQNTESGPYIQGTGMLTIYPVKKYDGVRAGKDNFMSGCLFNAPLKQSTPVYLYTSKIQSVNEFSKIFALRKEKLFKEGIVVGTIRTTEKEAFKQFVKGAGPLRLSFAGNYATDYDLFVLVPGSFVCRSVEAGQKVNHTYLRVTIEKLQ